MIIPGGTILLFFALTFKCELSIDGYKVAPVIGGTIVIVASYLLGLINHSFTSCLWKPFRNNPKMIQQAFYEDNENSIKKCFRKLFLCLPCILKISIIISIVVYIIVGAVDCFCRIDSLVHVLIAVGAILLICIISCCLYKDDNGDIDNKNLRKEYYEAYYYVAKNRYNDDIFIMEGQVAFIQNMIIPLLLIAFSPKCAVSNYINCENVWIVKILLAIGILMLILTVFQRQNKIYERVWEDYKYLRRLEEQNKQ